MKIKSAILISFALFLISAANLVAATTTAAQEKERADAAKLLADQAQGMQNYEDQLVTAIARDNDVEIKKLIKNSKFAIFAMGQPGFAIMASVHQHNYSVLDALLKNGANIDASWGPSHITGLMRAVERDDVKMVQYLLSHGADPFQINVTYQTAIDIGVSFSRKDAIIVVLQALKLNGKLDFYLKWEEMLSQLRIKLQKPLSNSIKAEESLLLRIHELSSQ